MVSLIYVFVCHKMLQRIQIGAKFILWFLFSSIFIIIFFFCSIWLHLRFHSRDKCVKLRKNVLLFGMETISISVSTLIVERRITTKKKTNKLFQSSFFRNSFLLVLLHLNYKSITSLWFVCVLFCVVFFFLLLLKRRSS